MKVRNITGDLYTYVRGITATAMCEHCARQQAARQKCRPNNAPPCPWKKAHDFSAAKGYGCPMLQDSLHRYDELMKQAGLL